jgi:hypothetical protein
MTRQRREEERRGEKSSLPLQGREREIVQNM